MRTSFFTALTAILSVAVALPTKTALVKREDPDTFELEPASGSPTELQGLGSLWFRYNGRFGGEMGWYSGTEDKVAQLFIQYNAKNGVAFYARATALQAYLVPNTGCDEFYQAKIANPEFEDVDPLPVKSDQFTLTTETVDGASTEYFGYAGESKWLACKNNGIYNLYFGENKCAGYECVPFKISTKHVPWGI